MKVGYTNQDIEYYLAEREKSLGPTWNLVVEMTEGEWYNLAVQSAEVVQRASGGNVSEQMRKRLQANAAVGFLLNLAEEEKYPDTKTMRDFLQICGTNFNPTISVQPLFGDRVAVIVTQARKTIKENMSPNRRFDE